MKRLALALLLLAVGTPHVSALTGADVDSADRFPFVVEIKLDDRLICSGTVLYPRIVVTAAHCLQQKVAWRGGVFYVDEYLTPAALSVTVLREGRVESYAVAETAISPSWRTFIKEGSVLRFVHDLALVITKDPISVEAPPYSLPTPFEEGPPRELEARSVLGKGLLVGFGGEHCLTESDCDDAGIRRFIAVVIRDKSHCFRNQRERSLVETGWVWCMDQGVMPGDSGGALLVEGEDGRMYFVGVISAQQGLPPELSGVNSWRRSLATDIDANLAFIANKARALGYAPEP